MLSEANFLVNNISDTKDEPTSTNTWSNINEYAMVLYPMTVLHDEHFINQTAVLDSGRRSTRLVNYIGNYAIIWKKKN